MKRSIISCLLLLCCSYLFTSCKKFLEETSQDEIRPSSTEDLTQLMNGEAYPYQGIFDTYTDLLTDDIQCTGVPTINGSYGTAYESYLKNGAPIFTFSPAMFDQNENLNVVGLSGVDSWKAYYSKIKGCNVVLDYVDKVAGTAQAKNGLRGQVLCLRGYYYLKLITLYGQPYSGNGINPATADGVPLILSSEVSDENKARNTLEAVYNQIEQDLLAAATLLKDNYVSANNFRLGHVAAYALLSRFYLYKGRDEDMDKVIEYAGLVLAEKPALTYLSTYFSSTNVFSTNGIYDGTISQEVIWTSGINPKSLASFIPATYTVTNFKPPYTVSQELVNLYDKGTGTSNQGDLRYVSWFAKNSESPTHPYRSLKAGYNLVYGDKGIRTAELYLNRAEALIRRYQKSGAAQDMAQAINDINTLRQSRYDNRNTAYVPVNFTDVNALFSFYKDERRRELALEENHRWVDIKRWGLSVTHHFIDISGVASDFTLASGSLLYALPIPYNAIERNYNLRQNPR